LSGESVRIQKSYESGRGAAEIVLFLNNYLIVKFLIKINFQRKRNLTLRDSNDIRNDCFGLFHCGITARYSYLRKSTII
jgi:hypothetical protein